MKPYLSKIPIYGKLVYSDKSALRSACAELSLATLFSLLPIWLYPTILRVGFGEPFWQNVASFVENGELFIFSSALVGPLIYSIMKRYGKDEESEDRFGKFPIIKSIQFPYGSLFVLISLFTCLFAAVFFGLMRVNSVYLQFIDLDEMSLLSVSIGMYVFTLSCYYCVSVYRLNLENIAGSFGKDTKDLMKQWELESD